MRNEPHLLVHLYKRALSKYFKYKERLDKAIKSGRFKDFNRREKSKLIHRLNKLKAQIDQYQLKLKVAVAAGALALTLTAIEPAQAQTNLGPFELQKRSKNPLRGPFATRKSLALVSVDIDNDNDFDVVAGTQHAGNTEIYFFKNNGTATQPRFDWQTGPWDAATKEGNPFDGVTFDAGDGYVVPAFANLDGDSDMDMFLGTEAKGFRYFKQNGDGSFTEQDDSTPWNPATGLGNPLENFDDNSGLFSGTNDLAPTFVDYDSDSDLDLVFGHDYDKWGAGTTQIHIIRNDGTNRFPELDVVDATESPFDGQITGGLNFYDSKPRLIDVDSDGDLDVFFGTYNDNIRFFKNNAGTYVDQSFDGAWVPATTAGNPLDGFSFERSAVDFVDLDGDTDLDALVFGNNANFKYEPSHIRYLRNDGGFVFTELFGPENPFDGIPQITDNGSQSNVYPAFIDFDLDTHPDVWVTELFDPAAFGPSDVSRLTLFNNDQTEAGFRFSSTFNLPANLRAFPVEANINGTGGDDLVIAQENGQITFYSNDGGGNFSLIASNDLNTKVAATSQVYPAFVDIDLDGDPDAFVTRTTFSATTEVEFYRNDGPASNPVFASVTGTGNPMNALTFDDTSIVTSADANNDGFKDLFVTSPTGLVRFFVNSGAGTFTEYTSPDRPLNGQSLYPSPAPKMVDIDQDGDKDIFVGSSALTFEQFLFFENTNKPPVVIPGGSVYTFNEGGPAITISTALELNDGNESSPSAHDTDVAHAKIQITSNYVNGQDVLSFTPVGNITSFFDAATGTLNLVGFDDMATYETALQSVKYTNTSGNPSTLPRTITWYVFDHDATDPRLDATADGTVSVNVVANAAPAVASSITSASYSSGSVVINNSFTVTDSDSPNLQSATIRIGSGLVSTEDQLLFTNVGPLTGSYSSATGTLTISGTATLSQYEAALESVQYNNTSGSPTLQDRVISFRVTDPESNISNNFLFTLDFPAPPNSAPVLTPGSTSVTFSGTAVTIDNGMIATDAEDAISSATVSIASGFVAGEDLLVFTDQNGITGSYDASSGILSLTGTTTAANYQAALRTIQYNNVAPNRTNTDRTISFVANDGVVSSNTVSLTLLVPNQTPALTITTTTVTFSGPDLPLDNTISITDGDDASVASASVVISAGFVSGQDELVFVNQNGITGTFNTTTGTLSLTGVATRADYETALRSILYRNTVPDRTNAPRTVSYRVNDGSVNSNLVSLSLLVPNLAPSITLSTPSASFTGSNLIIDANLTIADADDLNLSSASVFFQTGFVAGEDALGFVNQNGISGSFNASTGVLTLSGNATVAQYEAALRSVTYLSNATNRTPGIRDVAFQVSDGQATSSTTVVAVTVANSAPVLGIAASPAFYSTTDIVINNTITVTDADNTDIQTAVITISNNYRSTEDVLLFTNQNGITGTFSATTGTLTLTGVSSIGNYQAALRTVRYRNTATTPNTNPRTVAFVVSDNANSSAPVTTVVSINQPPTIDGGSIQTAAGGAVTLLNSEWLSDPDDGIDETTITAISSAGATVRIENGQIVVDYSGIIDFQGDDILTVTVCDQNGKCATQAITIEVEADIIVYNGVSPGNDNANDYFKIRFLPAGSKVSIYNRWGDLVYNMAGYDNNDRSRRFEGQNNNGNDLPSGTYFYKIETPQGRTITGYLTLKR